MADVIDTINPGWVTNKKGIHFSDNFQRISPNSFSYC